MITEILQGIDKTNVESIRGWWDTEREALRGENALKKIQQQHQTEERPQADFFNLSLNYCRVMLSIAESHNKILALYNPNTWFFGERS